MPEATDTVATTGGLVLPRAPFWQSVNGPESASRPSSPPPQPLMSPTRSSGLAPTYKPPGADAPMDDDDRYRPERAEEEEARLRE